MRVFRRENNGERQRIRGGDSGQGDKDGFACENGNAIDRDDIRANVFAADVANAGGRGAGDDAGDVAAFANVTSCYFKTEGRMVAFDELSDGVKAVERIVSDFEVQRRQCRALSGDNAGEGQVTEGEDIRRSVVVEVVHAFIEASMGGGLDNGAA